MSTYSTLLLRHILDAGSVYANYNMQLFDDAKCGANDFGTANAKHCGNIGVNIRVRCVKIIGL